MKKAYLVLENGTVFEGEACGADVPCEGELVFTTGVVGFADTLADPRAAGQIVMQTFPVAGCAGITEEEFARPIRAAGYVVRSLCGTPSNFRADHTVEAYLQKYGIPAITGADTREITRILREEGTLKARICREAPADCAEIAARRPENPMEALRTVRREIPAVGAERCRAALIDYGTAEAWTAPLSARGCTVTVLPHDVSAKELAALSPDGVFLTGGAGNPADNAPEIAVLAEIAGKYPLFAVGLGYQMFAIARGARTEKLHHGHRGANHPVRDLAAGRTYITAQNHGYAVKADSVTDGTVNFVSANDGTAEGIVYPALSAVTVQFAPTAAMLDAFVQTVCESRKKGGEA